MSISMDHALCIPLPDNEDKRIQVLYETKLLDTFPEEIYDRYTAFAKRIFKVPIALVSLVDHQRQWFKSRVGLEAQETHRDVAFCSYAVLERTPSVMVVNNALKDERFHNNPLVLGAPFIRFYAGAALVIDGVKIGTLCIIDKEPRSFTVKDEEKLLGLAEIVRDFIIERRNCYLDDLSNTLASVSPILQTLKLPLESYQKHFQQLVAISKENIDTEQRVKQLSQFQEKVKKLKDQMLQLSYINESVIQVFLMYSKLENWIGEIPDHFDLSPSKENERNAHRCTQLKNYFGNMCSPSELMEEIKELHFEQQSSPIPIPVKPVPLKSFTSRSTKRRITFSSHRIALGVTATSSSCHVASPPATPVVIEWIVEDPSFLHQSMYTYSPILRLILSLFTKLKELEASNHHQSASHGKELKLKIIQSSTNQEEGHLSIMIVSVPSVKSSLVREGSLSTILSLKSLLFMTANSSSILSGLFLTLDHLFAQKSLSSDQHILESASPSFLISPAISSSKRSGITSMNSSYRSSFSHSEPLPTTTTTIRTGKQQQPQQHDLLPPVDESPDNILFQLTIPYFIHHHGHNKNRTLLKPIVPRRNNPLFLPVSLTIKQRSMNESSPISSKKQSKSIRSPIKLRFNDGRNPFDRMKTVSNLFTSMIRKVFFLSSQSPRIHPTLTPSNELI